MEDNSTVCGIMKGSISNTCLFVYLDKISPQHSVVSEDLLMDNYAKDD